MHQHRLKPYKRSGLPGALGRFSGFEAVPLGGTAGTLPWACLVNAPGPVESRAREDFRTGWAISFEDLTWCNVERVPLTRDAVQRDVQTKVMEEMRQQMQFLLSAVDTLERRLEQSERSRAIAPRHADSFTLPAAPTLEAELAKRLAADLGTCVANVSVVEADDHDLGPILEAKVLLEVSREEFREARRRAMASFGELTRSIDTRQVVLLVDRA